MTQLVADTDVVSYIFKWHPLAPRYVELLADNEVVLSFVTLAEMRLGALKARRMRANMVPRCSECGAP
jgi:predicted nucleic acid-binding protein